MSDQITRAGVVGWPIDHSLSPRLHGYWLKKHRIRGSYEAIAVEGSALQKMMEGLVSQGFSGLNVTVPHKVAVMQHLDIISDQARRIGAVNTVVVGKNGRLSGSNTDGSGFIENLRQGCPGFDFTKGAAVVLGAGGAARAVVVALIDEGVPAIRLINRTRQKAEDLADYIGDPVQVFDWDSRSGVLEDAALLANTTSLGMSGKPDLDLSLDALPVNALVSDIVYTPPETNLLKAASVRGNKVVDGLGMLLHQARPGFSAWFGVKPHVTDGLRDHVLAVIEAEK